MYKKNRSEFELMNFPAWHDVGYTGKDIKFMELEGANPKNKQFDGLMHNDFDDWENEDNDYLQNSHGSHVFDVFHQLAPDAEMYVGSAGLNFKNGEASGDFLEKTVQYIKDKKINIVAASLGGNKYDAGIRAIRDLKENYNVTFITSAGNRGEKGAGDYAQTEEWINVAAIHYIDRKDEIVRPRYSSIDEVVTITMPSNIYVQSDKKPDYWFPVPGTSFSSPTAAAAKAVVDDKCLHEYGRVMSQKEFVNFIIDNVVDLGKKGHDPKYGHGLFVLPNPNSDLSKYFIDEDNDDSLSIFLENNIGNVIDDEILDSILEYVDVELENYLDLKIGVVIDDETVNKILEICK